MSDDHPSGSAHDGIGDETAAFPAGFPSQFGTSAPAVGTRRVWRAETSSRTSCVLVVERGPNAGSQFRLVEPVTSAGRNPDSDIFLDDITVSRRHAEFRREADGVRIVDVGSLNGTYVNHQRLDSEAALAIGDSIQIGKFTLVFNARPAAG